MLHHFVNAISLCFLFWQAILTCPQSLEDQTEFLAVSMEQLKLASPAKYAVARGLYYTANGAVIKGNVEDESDFKKELLVAMMPDLTPETVATPVGPDPLLAQCYGNRSAVLYEMKMYEVRHFRNIKFQADVVPFIIAKQVFQFLSDAELCQKI